MTMPAEAFLDPEKLELLRSKIEAVNEVLKGNIEQPVLIVEPLKELWQYGRRNEEGKPIHGFSTFDLRVRGGTLYGEEILLDAKNSKCTIPATNVVGVEYNHAADVPNRNISINLMWFTPDLVMGETTQGGFCNIIVGDEAIEGWVSRNKAHDAAEARETVDGIFHGGKLMPDPTNGRYRDNPDRRG